MMLMLISGHWTGTQFQTGGREPVYDDDDDDVNIGTLDWYTVSNWWQGACV